MNLLGFLYHFFDVSLSGSHFFGHPMLTNNFTLACAVKFCEHVDVAHLACVCRAARNATTGELTLRKTNLSATIFQSFRVAVFDFQRIKFSSTLILSRSRHDADFTRHARFLFCALPELFALMQENAVHTLDLSLTCARGGAPVDARDLLACDDDAQLDAVFVQLLALVRANRTLKTVNVGLFERFANVNRERVQLAIDGHPTLRWLTVRASGATMYLQHTPCTLYRYRPLSAPPGECECFVWSHFHPLSSAQSATELL